MLQFAVNVVRKGNICLFLDLNFFSLVVNSVFNNRPVSIIKFNDSEVSQDTSLSSRISGCQKLLQTVLSLLFIMAVVTLCFVIYRLLLALECFNQVVIVILGGLTISLVYFKHAVDCVVELGKCKGLILRIRKINDMKGLIQDISVNVQRLTARLGFFFNLC